MEELPTPPPSLCLANEIKKSFLKRLRQSQKPRWLPQALSSTAPLSQLTRQPAAPPPHEAQHPAPAGGKPSHRSLWKSRAKFPSFGGCLSGMPSLQRDPHDKDSLALASQTRGPPSRGCLSHPLQFAKLPQ